MFTEAKKDILNVLQVVVTGGAENQNVIEEDKHKNANEILHDVIHELLEDCWRVGEAKRHH
jgi:hypothetical protein